MCIRDRVDIAFEAQSGLRKARSFLPDVILCDIGLPVMDGYQVVHRLREDPKLSGCFVVALTGYGRDSDRGRAIEGGFDLHLTKPIELAMLRDALSQARFCLDRTVAPKAVSERH